MLDLKYYKLPCKQRLYSENQQSAIYALSSKMLVIKLYNVFQANNFVNKFHTEKINKLRLLLDSENWRQKVVPLEFQNLVEYIQNTGIYTIDCLRGRDITLI